MKKILLAFVAILCGCKTLPVDYRVKVLYNGGKPFVTYEMRSKNEISKDYD